MALLPSRVLLCSGAAHRVTRVSSEGFIDDLTPVVYVASTETRDGVRAAVQDALRSHRSTNVVPREDEDFARDFEAAFTSDEIAKLLRRVASLIAAFVESELDYTTRHRDGLARVDGSQRSADDYPRLGAAFRRRLKAPADRAAIGRAIEDIISTGYIGGAAANAGFKQPLELRWRPLGTMWQLWIPMIYCCRHDTWPRVPAGMIEGCSDNARGRFYEVARKLKLGRRILRDETELLQYLATFYTEAGAALFLVTSAETDALATGLPRRVGAPEPNPT
ncbi:MAG TPA: hypothetical protein VK501_05520 [Baekduia sp.]|nr:hypothetical protein [Baekduia sp.]